MESLCIGLPTSAPSLNYPKTQNIACKPLIPFQYFSSHCNSFCSSSSQPRHFLRAHFNPYSETPCCSVIEGQNCQANGTSKTHVSSPSQGNLHFCGMFSKPYISLFSVGFFFPLSCFASEAIVPAEAVPNKINLEAILVSIDDFFNRNPFFVAGVTFIWLAVIPLAQEYFRSYKFISAIDAFRKLRDDPNCQLLDIRDKKSLAFLNSPNLKILNKTVLQVEFRDGDEDGFVKQVLENFKESEKIVLCILDNFDGNSMKVAELLVNNGIKEAYAIRGGIRGEKGWQEIQETLLPPSVHVYAKKKVKISQQPTSDREVKLQNRRRNSNSNPSSSVTGQVASITEKTTNGSLKRSGDLTSGKQCGPRSSSPYPNYPDLKPPSSPTPSKPGS